MKTFPSSLLLAMVLASFPGLARAAIIGPYTADADTVHLWHLDENNTATTATDAAGGNALIAVDGNPIASPESGITGILGVSGAAGFGNAASIPAIDLGLGYDGNNNGVFDADVSSLGADSIATSTLVNAVDGAFTLEALVNLSSITGTQKEIISLEKSGTTDRAFQFVINTTGTLRFRDFGNGLTLEVAIPTVGVDAFAADTWFHTAYVYDGNGTGSFYWTLLDGSRTEANLIGTTGSALDLVGANEGMLVVGNENRGIFNEGLLGSIDEVRISNVARSADQFLFIPEPSSALLFGMGALTLAVHRRRR